MRPLETCARSLGGPTKDAVLAATGFGIHIGTQRAAWATCGHGIDEHPTPRCSALHRVPRTTNELVSACWRRGELLGLIRSALRWRGPDDALLRNSRRDT